MPVASLAQDNRAIEVMLSYQSNVHIKDEFGKCKAS